MTNTPSGTSPARRSRRCAAGGFLRSGIAPAALLIALAILTCSGTSSAQDVDIEQSVIAPLAPRSLLLDAAVVGDRIVVVGERGHVLISTDDGASWRQVAVPTRAMLTAVAFADDRVGVAVGHDSVILRTEDAGDSWELVYSAPEDEAPFFDVWFADAAAGFAIGAYGSHYRTADAGRTWSFEPIGDTDWHLHQIARSETGRLYLAAEAGFVYRSDDDGTTWTELPSPYEGSFFGVLPLDGDTVLLFGLRGHLFRSEDAGKTWNVIDTSTVAMLTDGARLADGTIVIVGLGGTVLVSTDGGASFSYSQRPGRRGISAVAETGAGTLVLVGEFGVVSGTLAELTAAAAAE